MTAHSFEKPSWELHPNYQPADMAEQRRLIEQWSDGRPTSFAAIPIASLVLSDPVREYLHQETLLGGGWTASGESANNLSDMFNGIPEERPTEQTKALVASYMAALQEIVGYDRSRSEAPELSIASIEVELNMYANKGPDDHWHCDALVGTARARNAIKYAVALMGPSTIFSSASFARTDYDEETGDMLPGRHPKAPFIYQPGTAVVMRFNGVTPHRAPQQHLAPRLFASITLHNPRLPH